MLLTETIIASGPEPVSVDDVKVSARIDSDITELDQQIKTLIEASRLAAEHECEQLFIPRTVRFGYSAWPECSLPVPPEAESATVEVLDGSDWVPVPTELVRFMNGMVRVVPTAAIPDLPTDGQECVRVDVKIDCPANIKAYVIAVVCHQLITPTAGRPENPPQYLAGLLDRERSWR